MTVSGTKKEYTVDVWSGNHPFYTGSNQALIVDEGRVNKFQKRFQVSLFAAVVTFAVAHCLTCGKLATSWDYIFEQRSAIIVVWALQGLSIGQVAPVSAGGNKKLEYKVEKDKGKKGKGKR